ncbi:MAG: Mur ligase family protein, partial [Gammaproteobacteria bacterium]
MMAPQSQMGVALSVLLDGILPVQAQEDRTISDIALNSRDVGPGTCFFALKGARANGMAFAAEAVARGAAAIVAEENEPALHFAIPVFELANLRGHLGEIARRFFDDPSAAVRVFAITGTNGKSTVAHIAAQAVNEMGETGGYIGTLGAGRLDQLTTIGMTTPDIITLNRWLARLRGENVGFVALEASSHALDQDRLSGLTLGAAAFTNLGHDHLDYHGDIEAYAEIKQRLFSHKGLATAIVNVDDPVGARIASSID